jgi:NADH-quinone oxidoreductase subunit A
MMSAVIHGGLRKKMTGLVFYLLVFLAIGVFFLFIHLLIGKLIRPHRPDAEKMTIYECGEPTVGSAWIQFDLRYYVVALLFVVFDVEVAFFFPWAVVFGKANELAKPDRALTEKRDRSVITKELAPANLNLAYLENAPEPMPRAKGIGGGLSPAKKGGAPKKAGKGGAAPGGGAEKKVSPAIVQPPDPGGMMSPPPTTSKEPPKDVAPISENTARAWAWIAFGDILVFFGVLMVGFAYLWKRGDIDWVRSTVAENEA